MLLLLHPAAPSDLLGFKVLWLSSGKGNILHKAGKSK